MAQVDLGDHASFVSQTLETFLATSRRRARFRVIMAGLAAMSMLGIFALVMSALG